MCMLMLVCTEMYDLRDRSTLLFAEPLAQGVFRYSLACCGLSFLIDFFECGAPQGPWAVAKLLQNDFKMLFELS